MTGAVIADAYDTLAQLRGSVHIDLARDLQDGAVARAEAATGRRPGVRRRQPLDADLVVIDETSMVDVILANKLVKAVAPGAHLLLGDC